ncbi:MAG: hypothetical protein R6V06_03630, partial [Kiritimatiellia bacterium]
MGIAEQEIRFTALVMAVVEDTATDADLADFHALLHEHPEFIFQYFEQMRVHGLMCRYLDDARCIGVPDRKRAKRAFFRGAWWKSAAAVAAFLMVTVIYWSGINGRSLWSDLHDRFADVPPVRIIHQSASQEVEMPHSLPGFVQSDSGELTVRLAS